jgi:hypothetical protein
MTSRQDDCPHETSLYGRCANCGMTWEEQDRRGYDVTSDIEAELDQLDPLHIALAPSDPEWDNEPMFSREGRIS